MKTAWEAELAQFLNDLSAVQDETLGVLVKKRDLLVAADTVGLASVNRQEESLLQRLQECLRRREDLLGRAAQEGLPSTSLDSLTRALPRTERTQLGERMQSARSKARLLQHHSLVNWMLVQRTLLHLSQVLEIIATGGRLQPTYGRGGPVATSGSLVDGAA
jgi:flagellar biosynthesis/type III secretory pathway chaperone